MAELIAKIGSKQVRLEAEETAPGIYSLKTTATLSGDIEVNPPIAELDAEKAVRFLDGANGKISIDANGRIWIAGRDLIEAIKNAGDTVIAVTSRNASLQPLTIDYVSAKWRIWMGSATLKSIDTMTYLAGGEWDSTTPSLTA